MKVVNKINWKVVVEPDGVIWESKNKARAEREARNECEQIKKLIAHHVSDIRKISIEHDTEELCSFCNERWDTDEDGCPTCCNAAITEWGNSYE